MEIEIRMIKVNRGPYWLSLIDYYYDHVHWDQNISIYQWLERDYGAHTHLNSPHICFNEQSRANWFHMRWYPSIVDSNSLDHV